MEDMLPYSFPARETTEVEGRYSGWGLHAGGGTMVGTWPRERDLSAPQTDLLMEYRRIYRLLKN